MISDREKDELIRLHSSAARLKDAKNIQVARAGERTEAIIRDVLYEAAPAEFEDWIGAHDIAYEKPLPIITDENRGHWEAAKNEELRLQRCSSCSYVRFPIATICPRCSCLDYSWHRLSGRGTLSSWVVFHKAYWTAFASDVPYIVAQIELEEGPRYLSNMQGEVDHLVAGMGVEVVFDHATAEVTIPKFRPIGKAIIK